MKIVLIITGLLLCSVVWSPDLSIDITTVPRYIAWSAAAILLLIVIFFQVKDFSIVRRRIFAALGIYLVICAISLVKAVNFGEWFDDFSKVTLLAIYTLCIALSLKDIRQISLPVVIMVIVLGSWAIWQVHTGNQMYKWSLATMGNKNLFSQFMLLCIPFCIVTRIRPLGYPAAAIAVYCIYLAGTAAAMVALAAAVVITIILFHKRALQISIVTFYIGLLIICYISIHRPDLTVKIPESGWARLYKWRQTLLMAKDNFLVGGGNWKVAILPYSSGFYEKKVGDMYYYRSAHNNQFEILAEKGIYGLIAYLSIFGFAMFYCYKSGNIWVMFGLVSFFVYTLFDNKQMAPNMMLLSIYLGLAVAVYHDYYMLCECMLCEWKIVNFKRYLPICLLMLSVVMYGYIVKYDMLARFKITGLDYANRDHNDPNLIINNISRIPVTATLHRETTPYCWFLGCAYEKKGDRKRAYEYYNQAYELNPYNKFVLLSLGEFLFYAGRTKESIYMYEQCLKTVPNEPVAMKNLELIRGSM